MADGRVQDREDATVGPSLRLVAHGSGLGRRPAPAGGKERGLVQRQMRTGSAVEGGSPAGAAGARRQGQPWREAHLPEQQEQLQPLVGPTHRLIPASSAAARTVERGSCVVAGGEFSGLRLLSSSNPVSHLVSALGAVVPSTTVKHQVQFVWYLDLSSSRRGWICPGAPVFVPLLDVSSLVLFVKVPMGAGYNPWKCT